jgi:hypothetical protein
MDRVPFFTETETLKMEDLFPNAETVLAEPVKWLSLNNTM